MADDGQRISLNRRSFMATAAGATAAVSLLGRGERSNAAGGTAAMPEAPLAGITREAFAKARSRAAAIAAKMTPAELASQLGNTTIAIKRLGLPAYQYWHEALHGLLRGGPVSSFPIPLAMANTWDPELQYQVYNAVSDEARAYHNTRGTALAFYSPQTLNTARDPRWGRIDETLGEDPHLIGEIAGAAIRGMQGGDPRYLKTVCCAKHFICNETDDDRHTVSESVNSRSFWEYFTQPFKSAVNAGVATVMSSYNSINGIPCTGDRTLLTGILRRQWGFRGYVTSDCDAVADIYQTHHYVPTAAQAAAMGLRAGCDLNCGDTYQHHAVHAMDLELVTRERVAESVTRLLTIRMLLGEFDSTESVPFSRIGFNVVDSPKHRQIALQAARESIVLLKNDNAMLPLKKSEIKSIAVIGPLAGRCPLGGYAGGPLLHISPLQGIAAQMGVDIQQNRIPAVNFTSIDWRFKFTRCTLPDSTLGLIRNTNWVELPAADFSKVTSIKARVAAMQDGSFIDIRLDSPGGPVACSIPVPATGGWHHWKEVSAPAHTVGGSHAIFLVARGPDNSPDLFHTDWIELEPAPHISPGRTKITSVLGATVSGPRNQAWLDEAANAAKSADIAVVVVGDDQTVDHEQLDRADIRLPGAQHELIQVVSRANPKTIVIVTSNCPVAIPAEQRSRRVPAILCALAAGQAGGEAIADILFGRYNPGGKLAETWYTGIKQLPGFHDFNIMNNRTYMYFTGRPLYPFGHGLSYTSFSLPTTDVSAGSLIPGGEIAVTVTVKNTGKTAGDEVVQLYVRSPKSPVKRPQKQLAAFARVKQVPAGASRRVTLQLRHDHPALRFWDEANQRFVIQPGRLTLMVGTSSDRIIHRRTVNLTA